MMGYKQANIPKVVSPLKPYINRGLWQLVGNGHGSTEKQTAKAREDPHSYWWYDRNWFNLVYAFMFIYLYNHYIEYASVSWFRSKQFQWKLFPNGCFLMSSWHLKLARTRGAEWPLSTEDLHSFRSILHALRPYHGMYSILHPTVWEALQDLESMHFHPGPAKENATQRPCQEGHSE